MTLSARCSISRASATVSRRAWSCVVPICPIDDGAASLDDPPAVKQDRQAGLFGTTAFRQNYVDARRPIDFVISNAMPVERPSSFLAIMRNPEGDEFWL